MKFKLKAAVAAIGVGLGMLLTGLVVANEEELDDRLLGIVEPLTASESFEIGLGIVHLNDDFWRGIAYGIEDEAKRSNVKLRRVFVAGNYGNVREQFSQLGVLKTLGVDVAVLGAAAFDGYEPILRDLKASGINVMAVGIPVNSESVSLGVGQDDAGIGRVLAKQVCDTVPSPHVLALPGPAGAEWARLRHDAFNQTLKEQCPDSTIIDASYSKGLTLQDGMSQASDLLLKNPDVNAIFTPQVSLGMGASRAVKQQGSEAKVFTSALVPEAISAIQGGDIEASVSEPGILMGRLIVQYAIRQAEGKDLPNIQEDDSLPYPYIMTPSLVLTSDNAAEFPVDLTDFPPKDWEAAALSQ